MTQTVTENWAFHFHWMDGGWWGKSSSKAGKV